MTLDEHLKRLFKALVITLLVILLYYRDKIKNDKCY